MGWDGRWRAGREAFRVVFSGMGRGVVVVVGEEQEQELRA